MTRIIFNSLISSNTDSLSVLDQIKKTDSTNFCHRKNDSMMIATLKK